MYLDEVYNFCLKHFVKFCVLAEINAENHDFDSFFMVSPRKSISRQFSLSFDDQRVKLHKYCEFQINRRYSSSLFFYYDFVI